MSERLRTSFFPREASDPYKLPDFDAENLEELGEAISAALSEIRAETGIDRTALVSGKIGASTHDQERMNRQRLLDYANKARLLNKDLILISFSDFFGEKNDLYNKVTRHFEQTTERRDALCDFSVQFVWREISDLVLTPGWETSQGSRLEYEAATAKNCRIYLPEKHPDMIFAK